MNRINLHLSTQIRQQGRHAGKGYKQLLIGNYYKLICFMDSGHLEECFLRVPFSFFMQDKKLKVLSVAVQKSVRNLVGRSVRVDALCLLGTGEKVNACL